MQTKRASDVDIDLADRDQLLRLIQHTPAAQYNVDPPRRHPTGVHVTPIPYNPLYDMCAINYTDAEDRGYFKLDLLNVHLYSRVRSEEHLQQLMNMPDWTLLQNRDFVERLIHIGRHYDALAKMPQPITKVSHLAMFLAAIRPAKRHLIGRPWHEVEQTIWHRYPSDSYFFKKSHSYAYAYLVIININLLVEEGLDSPDQGD